jgi:UDP:flavonoid glycosyltransferase YjiC (YdhE family)
MADILIAALSPDGHIAPMLTVAADQVKRGNTVTMLTGAAHTAAVRAVGARAHPLPALADFDDNPFDATRRRCTSPIRALNQAIIRLFLEPMPHQAAELAKVLGNKRFDAIIADYGFVGVLPLLLGDPAQRPPVLYYTPTPLMLSSRDTAPYGLGLPPRHPWCNRALTVFSQRVLLREAHHTTNTMLASLGSRALPTSLLDVGVLADRLIVPTVPLFEYPRSDLPENVRFVGAVHPRPTGGFTPPPWWSEIDAHRPVVHVTQGDDFPRRFARPDVDDTDMSRLIEPTIDALRDADVTVIVTTCGTPLRSRVPTNTFVADHIPYDVLLPKIDVMVTNGGYGAVQRAVAAGVPLVVAGGTEDKPEVAARVAWSGTGINLRTGTPSATAVAAAVNEVLRDDRYRRRARELEVAFAQRDGVAEIAALIDEVTAPRRRNGCVPVWNAAISSDSKGET